MTPGRVSSSSSASGCPGVVDSTPPVTSEEENADATFSDSSTEPMDAGQMMDGTIEPLMTSVMQLADTHTIFSLKSQGRRVEATTRRELVEKADANASESEEACVFLVN